MYHVRLVYTRCMRAVRNIVHFLGRNYAPMAQRYLFTPIIQSRRWVKASILAPWFFVFYGHIYCGEAGFMHEARILKGCNCTKICSKLKMKCIQLTHLSLVFQHMDWLVILLRDNSHLSDRENINFMHPLTKMMIEKHSEHWTAI